MHTFKQKNISNNTCKIITQSHFSQSTLCEFDGMGTYTSLHYNTIDAKINSFDNNVLQGNAQWRFSSSSVDDSFSYDKLFKRCQQQPLFFLHGKLFECSKKHLALQQPQNDLSSLHIIPHQHYSWHKNSPHGMVQQSNNVTLVIDVY